VSWYGDRNELLEQRQALLQRMQTVAASLPALRAASADKRDEGSEAATSMLPGTTDAAAAAAAGRWHKVAPIQASTVLSDFRPVGTRGWHMIGPGFSHLIALILLMFGLAGGIVLEVHDWSIGSATQPTFPNHGGLPANAGPSAGPATRTNEAAAQNRLKAWRDQILLRPLFTSGRRPTEVTAQSASGLSRLTGIILTATRRVAIFAAQSGGSPIIVEEGARVGDYEVRQIAGTSVTVARPEGITVIRPIFDPAPAIKPKPGPATPSLAVRAAPALKP
jgi:hypothetical protein